MRTGASVPHAVEQVYILMYISAMAKRYSIAEARSNLPRIVDQAEAGQEIELTRRGTAVAVVISLREYARLRGVRTPFGDAYRHFLSGHALGEVGLEPGALEHARAKDAGRKVEL
jgi:prevent-host-death family protein